MIVTYISITIIVLIPKDYFLLKFCTNIKNNLQAISKSDKNNLNLNLNQNTVWPISLLQLNGIDRNSNNKFIYLAFLHAKFH